MHAEARGHAVTILQPQPSSPGNSNACMATAQALLPSSNPMHAQQACMHVRSQQICTCMLRVMTGAKAPQLAAATTLAPGHTAAPSPSAALPRHTKEGAGGRTDLRTAAGPSGRSRQTRATASWPPEIARGPSSGPTNRGPPGSAHSAVTPPGWPPVATAPVCSPEGACADTSPAAVPQQRRPSGTAARARILHDAEVADRAQAACMGTCVGRVRARVAWVDPKQRTGRPV